MPASSIAATIDLGENAIADAPIAAYFPRQNKIHVIERVGGRAPVVHVDAPDFAHLGERRLYGAEVIGATGLQHGLFAVPIPAELKARVRDAVDRALQFSVLPG